MKIKAEFELKMKVTVEHEVPEGYSGNVYTQLLTYVDQDSWSGKNYVHIVPDRGNVCDADVLEFKRIIGEEKKYE